MVSLFCRQAKKKERFDIWMVVTDHPQIDCSKIRKHVLHFLCQAKKER